MKIAIYGPGAMGSAFALHLARAGHDITVVARGKRLEQLTRDGAIVPTVGERAPVTVASSLDASAPFDLVLVTVLATQVDAILPALQACSARKVMFMFNTFRSIEPLRAAVGAERFTFGFPAGVFVLLDEAGRITPQVNSGTTVSDSAWATEFSQAGIPTVVEQDMQSYLRSHAAMVYPLMAMSVVVLSRGRGLSWGEAGKHADALFAGLKIVRALGSDFRPAWMGTVAGLPRGLAAALLWALSRTKTIRDLGKLGSTEARMLADMMSADMPSLASPVTAVRP